MRDLCLNQFIEANRPATQNNKRKHIASNTMRALQAAQAYHNKGKHTTSSFTYKIKKTNNKTKKTKLF
jgi:hypothetical protein